MSFLTLSYLYSVEYVYIYLYHYRVRESVRQWSSRDNRIDYCLFHISADVCVMLSLSFPDHLALLCLANLNYCALFVFAFYFIFPKQCLCCWFEFSLSEIVPYLCDVIIFMIEFALVLHITNWPNSIALVDWHVVTDGVCHNWHANSAILTTLNFVCWVTFRTVINVCITLVF